MKKICLVTTRHISYNPRVLKEADALSAAGYEVTVVTINNHEEQRRFDEELMRSRNWKLSTVNFRRTDNSEKRRWLYLSVRQKGFRLLSKISLRSGIAERAAEKAFDGLTTLATQEKADLYLAHHAEALGAAFRAARRNKAMLGFDAEDFHTGMDEAGGAWGSDRLIAYLEAKYLPHCRYLTAASKGIAMAYEEKYGIPRPAVILNVFPWEDLAAEPAHVPVRFYWYSQVIGPNRGLELLLEAAGMIGASDPGFEIYLRGSVNDPDYRSKLETLAASKGVRDKLFIYPPILAEAIVRDGHRFDVGLALESDISVNRNICVTNKVFSYLMSRLFLIGTATYGQKDIFSYFPSAVRMCGVNRVDELAEAMRWVIRHPAELTKGKKAAANAVTEQFNWDLESKKLLLLLNEFV
jgi:glycosyltransferase involved in cell wall biosynthesis